MALRKSLVQSLADRLKLWTGTAVIPRIAWRRRIFKGFRRPRIRRPQTTWWILVRLSTRASECPCRFWRLVILQGFDMISLRAVRANLGYGTFHVLFVWFGSCPCPSAVFRGTKRRELILRSLFSFCLEDVCQPYVLEALVNHGNCG